MIEDACTRLRFNCNRWCVRHGVPEWSPRHAGLADQPGESTVARPIQAPSVDGGVGSAHDSSVVRWTTPLEGGAQGRRSATRVSRSPTRPRSDGARFREAHWVRRRSRSPPRTPRGSGTSRGWPFRRKVPLLASAARGRSTSRRRRRAVPSRSSTCPSPPCQRHSPSTWHRSRARTSIPRRRA